jgi:hypothetical protein
MQLHDKNLWYSVDEAGDRLSVRRGFLGTTRKVVSAFLQTSREGSYVQVADIPALVDVLWKIYDESEGTTWTP